MPPIRKKVLLPASALTPMLKALMVCC